jgi:hypothetical protein
VTDALKHIETGGKFMGTLLSILLKGDVAAKLNKLSSIGYFEIRVSTKLFDLPECGCAMCFHQAPRKTQSLALTKSFGHVS